MILKITTYVMMFAPVAIFAAIAGAVSTQGVGIIVTYAKLVGDFYLALLILIACMIRWRRWCWRARCSPLLKAIRSPALIAFSTSTSEAAFPLLLELLEAMGFSAPRSSASSCRWVTVSIWSARPCIAPSPPCSSPRPMTSHVPLSQQILMLLMLMVTSKGIAGVPRASLVVVAATLPYFNLPEQGLFLILAVDHLMDMGRSATNVIGNGLASAVVAKWENARPIPVGARPEALV